MNALVSASVIFYVKCFLLKAEHYKHTKQYHKNKDQTQQESYFLNTSVAISRMENDIKIIRDYFESVAVQNDIPALCLLIEKEFQILTILLELIRIANEMNYNNFDSTNSSNSNISSYYGEARNVILVLHKQLKDVNVTKCVVSDIWHLIQPSEEIIVWKMMKTMENSFIAVCPPDKSSSKSSGNGNNGVNTRVITGLQLSSALAKHYSESKRKRPLSSGNNIRMMMMQSMKKRVGSKQTAQTRKRTSGSGGKTAYQIEARV
jgi:hypothetical protein